MNQNDTDFPLSGGEEPDFDPVEAVIIFVVILIIFVVFIYTHKHRWL